MATCPKCGGDLSGDHRCFGAWRHIARTASAALAGALFGVVLVLVLADPPSTSLLVVAALLSALVVTELWRATGL